MKSFTQFKFAKIFTVLLFIFSSHIPIYSFQYETTFNKFDSNLNNGRGYSTTNNLTGQLAWGESYMLMSYMNMYKATKNKKHLQKMIGHIERVLAQRDDQKNRKNYLEQKEATWVSTKFTNGKPYAWVAHSGMITYPIAALASTIIKDGKLRGVRSTSSGMYRRLKLIDIARDLIKRVQETIDAHEDQWNEPKGKDFAYYKFPNDTKAAALFPYKGAILPLNMMQAMGRTYIRMYQATGKASFKNRARKMANWFKSKLRSENGSYVWPYWGYKGANNEDLSHGSLSANFAYECYKAGIVFNKGDMVKFAATFKNNLYKAPLQFNDRVNRSGNANTYRNSVGRWMSFAEFDPEIYSIIKDVYIDTILYSNKITSPLYFLGIANIILHENSNDYTITSTNRQFGSKSDWAGITAGDFDKDGKEELVAIRNFDGNFYMYEVGSNKTISFKASYTKFGSKDWAGITAGDFDGDGKDEFVAVRNSDGNFYMFELKNNKIVLKATYTNYGSASKWAGLSAGDFDGDGKDEFVAVRNFNGQIIVLEFKNNKIIPKASYEKFLGNSNWASISAGDFDGNGVDEFAAVRNIDGNLYLFKLNNNNISLVTTYRNYGSASQWTNLISLDIDNDNKDEIFMHRNFDGDFFVLDYSNGQKKFTPKRKYFFPENYRMGPMCSLKDRNNENVAVFRQADANLFIYNFGKNNTQKQAKDNNAKNAVQEKPNSAVAEEDGPEEVVVTTYPNPTSETAKVSLFLTKAANVSVDVYGLSGATLSNQPKKLLEKGNQELPLRLENLKPGIYFCHIRIDDKTHIQKIIKE